MGEYIFPLDVVDISCNHVNNYDLPKGHLIQSPCFLIVRVRSQLDSLSDSILHVLNFIATVIPYLSSGNYSLA